jgi:hypothetical protein
LIIKIKREKTLKKFLLNANDVIVIMDCDLTTKEKNYNLVELGG